MRVIYLGTPEFAVPTLRALIDADDFEVVGLLCQPDRPRGRGNKVQMPPTKKVALEHDIPVFQPEKLSRSDETFEAMQALSPDVLVMVAFGQILKKKVLTMAPFGVINLHGSLLPRYRGPAPINWAIINGETETGLTTMKTDPGVDTGPMLLKKTIPIGDETTARELSERMAETGAPLMLETLRALKEGKIEPQPQDAALATYAPLLEKPMGAFGWDGPPARHIHNLVRGLQPWPGAYTIFRGNQLKLHQTRLVDGPAEPSPPGTICRQGEKVLVSCGPEGRELLELLIVQPQSKARQKASDWANGVRLAADERLIAAEPEHSR